MNSYFMINQHKVLNPIRNYLKIGVQEGAINLVGGGEP